MRTKLSTVELGYNVPGLVRTSVKVMKQYVLLCRVNSATTYTRIIRTNFHSRGVRYNRVILYSRTQMRSPYPEFVLTNIICNEKALKGTEIVFILTGFKY